MAFAWSPASRVARSRSIPATAKLSATAISGVAKALEKVRQDAVLDGELVALDAHGISRFQLLQNALRAEATLRYCIFDVMFLDGEDLRSLPLIERKERLRRILPKNPLLAFSEHRKQHGTKYFKEAEKDGLEGIMAKRAAASTSRANAARIG